MNTASTATKGTFDAERMKELAKLISPFAGGAVQECLNEIDRLKALLAVALGQAEQTTTDRQAAGTATEHEIKELFCARLCIDSVEANAVATLTAQQWFVRGFQACQATSELKHSIKDEKECH